MPQEGLNSKLIGGRPEIACLIALDLHVQFKIQSKLMRFILFFVLKVCLMSNCSERGFYVSPMP